MTITLTEAAGAKLAEFLAAEQDAEHVALRVAVQAGGCAGFRYALFFDDRELEGDHVSEQHGIVVRVDEASGRYLDGATVDWTETLESSGFKVDNPNAKSTCACGESAAC